jgi:hypothetical protein
MGVTQYCGKNAKHFNGPTKASPVPTAHLFVLAVRAVFYVHWDTFGTSKTTVFTQISGLGARGTLIENKKLYKNHSRAKSWNGGKSGYFWMSKRCPSGRKIRTLPVGPFRLHDVSEIRKLSVDQNLSNFRTEWFNIYKHIG